MTFRNLSKEQHAELCREFEEFDKACEEGKVASGGWCKCCERYDCGRQDHSSGATVD